MTELNNLFLRTLSLYWTLLKIMLPVLVLVRVLEEFGGTYYLSLVLSPLMEMVGLPAEMGLVWAAALLVNIYTGIAVYFSLALTEPLTVAQVTVLSTMILVAHALPLENAIAKAAGLRWRYTLCLRIFGALILGGILNLLFTHFNILLEPSQVVWQLDVLDTSLQAWLILQFKTLALVFVIIAALVLLLRLIEYFGVEKWLHWLLSPFLTLLGIDKEAANITVIGMTMGLTYGGGLLVEQAKSGNVSKRNIFLSMSLLCLCHALIEETLLALLLGANIVGVFWARLIFAFVVVIALSKLYFLVETEPDK